MPASTWRGIGSEGAYPAWLRALVKSSGVYAIRSGGVVVYVGESHKGTLKKTIVRHFQAWSRSPSSRRKQTFLGWMFGSSSDPGRTYSRGSCEVRFQVTAPGAAAISLQAEWIKRLRPRDNINEVPF